MARPRNNSVEALTHKLDVLFEECERVDVSQAAYLLSDHNVGRRLGVSPRQLDKYYAGDIMGDGADYKAQMQRLIAYRQALCVRNIAKGGQVSGWIFLSKQPRWGGFQDVQKVENNGKQTLEIKLNGADGNPLKHGKN